MALDQFSRSGMRLEPNLGVICIMTLAVMSGAIPTLQPLLLASLNADGKISASQIGLTASAESLGMAMAVLVVTRWSPTNGIRKISAGATAACVAMNLITLAMSGVAIIVARGLAGICEGILLWLMAAILARSQTPARLTGIYVFVLGAATFALSAVYSEWVIASFGSSGGYLTLALIFFFLLGPCAGVPSILAALPTSIAGWMPNSRGWLGLCGCFLHFAAIMALWVYIVPLATHAGLTLQAANYAVSAAILMQIPAGIISAAASEKLDGKWIIPAIVIANTAILSILVAAHSPAAVFVTTTLFGFLWFFVIPFQISALAFLDRGRRAVMLSGTAQMLGGSSGAALGAFSVARWGLFAAPTVALSLFLAAGLVMLVARFTADPRLQP